MAITVERMEVLGVSVHNLEKARELFARLFGIEFSALTIGRDVVSAALTPKTGEVVGDPKSVIGGGETPIAVDSTGFFELMQVHDDARLNGTRNIHFKVPDIHEAVAEMQANGIRLLSFLRSGSLREAIFHPDDLFGVRVCLVEYDAPSLIAAVLLETSAEQASADSI